MSFAPIFGGFGSGGTSAATFKVATTQVAVGASTGTQDITVSGFGTPKAALFIGSSAQTAGTPANQTQYSLGATDGTNQWVASSAATHAQNPTKCGRRGATDEVLMILDGNASVVTEANFDSWVTDGVRINVTATDASARLVTVVLFGGTDLLASAGTKTLGADTVAVTVTPGFEANAIIAATPGAGSGANFDDTGNSVSVIIGGLASWDGSTIRQAVFVCAESSSLSTTAPRGLIRDGGIFQGQSTGSSSPGPYAAVSAVGSTSFDITSTGDASGHDLGYLALGGFDAWAGILDSPTTTGDKTFSGPSFTPSGALFLPTMHTGVDATDMTGDSSAWGLSAITAAAQYSTAWASEDNTSPSDTQSVAAATAINLDDHTGAAAFDATFSAWTSTGVTLNFTAADATVRKWPTLFIG